MNFGGAKLPLHQQVGDSRNDMNEVGCFPSLGNNLNQDQSEMNSFPVSILSAFPSHNIMQETGNLPTPLPPDFVDVDRLLAADMNKMSVAEREKVYDDIHGTSKPAQENPMMLEMKLAEMRNELEKIPNKTAYNQAKVLHPQNVQDEGFQRMFLRAKEYNPREAALQMVSFYEIQLRLFGPNLLGRKIRWSDLSQQDHQALLEGGIQRIPHKDQSGRAIHFTFQNVYLNYDPLTTCRMFYYFTMATLEDESVQRNGAVVILWTHGAKNMVLSWDMEYWRLAKALPVRTVSLHYCGTEIQPMLHLSLQLSNSHFRTRFKTHIGSPMEGLYKLGGYGIRKDSLPVDELNQVSLQAHWAWLQERQILEQQQAKTKSDDHMDSESMWLQPGRHDVLLGGNSKGYYENPGNVAFRHLLERHELDYDRADSNEDKRHICDMMIKTIENAGGRFLIRSSKDANGSTQAFWEVMAHKDAQKRIGQAFRNRRNRRRPSTDKSFLQFAKNIQKK